MDLLTVNFTLWKLPAFPVELRNKHAVQNRHLTCKQPQMDPPDQFQQENKRPLTVSTLRRLHQCLFSIDTVQQTPLTKDAILETYSDLFQGIGTFPGDPYKFNLKKDAKPARHAPRKVPIHLKEAFREEIDNLVEQGILEPVDSANRLGQFLCHCGKGYFH